MKKYILLICLVVFFAPACTVYTEKQSEAISRTVYATKDSLDMARVDLADQYASESTRIIKPPKNRIKIDPIYKKGIDVVASQAKPSSKHVTPTNAARQRVLIIPEKYRNDTVVVVSSEEYQQLLKDKDVFIQLQKDFQNLNDTKFLVSEELRKQMEYNDKMIKDLNIMQKKLVEKDLAILQRNVIIVVLLALIAGATYLRIKGIL